MRGDFERPEEAIERVLSALREAEALPGLEVRVRAALEGRIEAVELERSRRGWDLGSFGGWRWSAAGRVTFAAALLCAAGVGGAIALRHGVERHSRGQEILRGSGVRPRVQSGATFAGRVAGAGMAKPPARGGDVEGGGSRRHAAGLAVVRGEVRSGEEKVMGGSLTRVSGRERASFPAPPLPLTEQERLLLRLVHRGDTQEIAMLDPVVRLAEARRERAQFKEFFAPAVVADAEPAVPVAAKVPASQSSDEAGPTPVYVEPAAGSGVGERWNAKARMTRRRR